MELYQLRTFLTVAAEGHLTRAAEKLNASQPAVSGQLRMLEEELGVKLFDRSPKGMVLTSAGGRLRQQAERIVEAARAFKSEADGLRDKVAGELTFGLNNQPDVLRLIPTLQRLSEQYPDLCYDLIYASSGVILQGLDEGSISIGFFEGAHSNPRLVVHQLEQVELCLAAPTAWTEELSQPDWKLLETKPWIFVSPMCSYFRAIESLCREQGLNLRHRFRVDDDLSVLDMIAEGLGMSLVGRHQVEQSPLRDDIFMLPHFRASVPLNLAYMDNRANDPAITAVRDTILDIWSTPAPPPRIPGYAPRARISDRLNRITTRRL